MLAAGVRTSAIACDIRHVRHAPGLVATVGFILLSIYVLSGFANDWCLRAFGTKAYLSAVTLVLLPLAWIFSGAALRGLRSTIGLCWAAFLVWMIAAIPLSVWKGGSATMAVNYIPRAYLIFFYTCAFVTSVERCRQWMYVQIASCGALLISCAVLGGTDGDAGGRFRIPDSLFYANSNDLALALLVGITSVVFLFYKRSIIARMAALAGILLAASYACRTGSRGCVFAAAVLAVLILWTSRNRGKVAVVVLAAGCVALVAAGTGQSSSALHRLSLLITGEPTQADSQSDQAAVASQLQRRELFKTSLRYAFLHPVFGVGPDQFAAAISNDSARNNVPAQWLGTHNTYTQVASECGIPAFLFYVAVIGLSLRANWRLYRQTRDIPPLNEIAGLSQCLLAGTLLFATSALFFHIAYSAFLPAVAGFTVALQLAPITATLSTPHP